MNEFVSDYQETAAGDFPEYTGTRIMMMPFRTDDVWRTLPESVSQYAPMVQRFVDEAGFCAGVGYLTVDEAELMQGEHHRRPGMHVDGVDEVGGAGGWGPSPGHWGAGGMVIASTHVGCRAWRGRVSGLPRPNGACDHVVPEGPAAPMVPGAAYLFGPMTLHESLPVEASCKRQFIRVSGPSDGAWYDGYTRNPLGVEPTGEIRARRAFMDYRP